MPVFLVCEGAHDSLDVRVLNALVVQRGALAVQTEPTGGDGELGAVRKYIERPKAQTNPPALPDVAVIVEDRNYHPRANADATWAQPAKRRFMWRRHEIENYLLHPAVVAEAFGSFQKTVRGSWVSQLPTSQPDTEAFLRSIASSLIENHAGEALKYELVGATNAQRLRFSPPAVKPPQGASVAGRGEWLSVLVTEATRVVGVCQTASALALFQQCDLETRYDALVAQFRQPHFFDSGNYLCDMGGKEFIKSLARQVRQFGVPSLGDDFLASELLAALARVYQPNTLFQPDDFAELAAILSQY